MSESRYISVPELARRLGVSARAARIHVEAGRIPGVVRLGRTYHVPATALDALAEVQAAERREGSR